MTVGQLVPMHGAEPFRPFRIHLADDRNLSVEHPEFLAYTPKGRTAIVMRLDETYDGLDFLLVSSLEVIDGKPRGWRNA